MPYLKIETSHHSLKASSNLSQEYTENSSMSPLKTNLLV